LPPPRPTLFPYTTLFRSAHLNIGAVPFARRVVECNARVGDVLARHALLLIQEPGAVGGLAAGAALHLADGDDVSGRRLVLQILQDRKSTRLNSSHDQISY